MLDVVATLVGGPPLPDADDAVDLDFVTHVVGCVPLEERPCVTFLDFEKVLAGSLPSRPDAGRVDFGECLVRAEGDLVVLTHAP